MNLLPEIVKLPTGIDWEETWGMAEADGTAIDLTGYSYVFEIREKDGATVTTGTATVSDAAAGQITLSLTAAQIAALAGRILQWALIETDSNDKDTAFTGAVEIVDIT